VLQNLRRDEDAEAMSTSKRAALVLALVAVAATATAQTVTVALRTKTAERPAPVDGVVTITLESGATIRLRAQDIDYEKSAAYTNRVIIVAESMTSMAAPGTNRGYKNLVFSNRFVATAWDDDIDLEEMRNAFPVYLVRKQKAAAAQERADKPIVAYLVDTVSTLRETPAATGKVVGTVTPLAVVTLEDAQTGWVQVSVGQGQGKPPLIGWLQGSRENILTADYLDSMMRLVRTEREPWPTAVKADVMRQRPRIGFTKEQVTAALGVPVSRVTEETATGVTEVWVYPGRSVVFKGDRVATIKKVE
jgi:hypothetical protein